MFYTGIGSRKTPDEILSIMEDAAFRLGRLGFTLRTGKAAGADAAFQKGVQKLKQILDYDFKERYNRQLAEIYIPWNSFVGDKDLEDSWDISLEYIDYLMPEQRKLRNILLENVYMYNYEQMKKKSGAFSLHSRNIHQVLGVNLFCTRPSKFCLYFTEEDAMGNPKGGTATAVNLSKLYGIKTLNLNTDNNILRLENMLQNMESRVSGKKK